MTTQRICVVTGGNRGIGLETVKQLAAAGFHVILASRSGARGDEAARLFGGKVTPMTLDLGSLASVRAFVDAFKSKGLALHVLINNAGVYNPQGPRTTTVDGFEAHFGTNHLGHHLLTLLLLDTLAANAPARVVTMSSGLHNAMPGNPAAHLNFDDLQMEKNFDGARAYAASKLANVLFAYELQRRAHARGITSLAADPGLVPETVANSVSGVRRLMMKYVMPHMPFARTLQQAAGNSVYVATSDAPGGTYIADQKAGKSSDESYDVAIAARLWDVSNKLTGLG